MRAFTSQGFNDLQTSHKQPQEIFMCKLKKVVGRSLKTQRRRQLRFICQVSSDSSSKKSCDIVWFKSDLRVHDHPGLHRAQKSSRIQPVYILDPQSVVQKLREPNGIEGLVGSCNALNSQLQKLGSKLLILEGKPSEALPRLAKALNSDLIITEEEVEYGLRQELKKVRESLSGAELATWTAPIFEEEAYGQDYREYKKRRKSMNEPLPVPTHLPSPADAQHIPSSIAQKGFEFAQWKKSVEEADYQILSPEVRNTAKEFVQGWGASETHLVQNIAEFGEAQALETFREYLQAGSGSQNKNLQEAIDKTESRAAPLGSFPAIFSQSLALGTISRRQIYKEAQEVGSQKGLKTAKAALITADAADFHWKLAREDGLKEAKVATVPRHWRWRGFLTDYFTADPEEFGAQSPSPDAPAFLLVHGFGAFGSQWRGQIKTLASEGHLVYAPTLPGYGRAEKPSLPYSQQLWVEFLRDFVVEIIRRPVVVVGNSIGGFMSASLAADYTGLVKGLVLMNSAGLLVKNYKPPENGNGITAMNTLMSGPPVFIVDAITSALLFYLEKTIERTLKKAYPVNPGMADAWLTTEIARAAGDLGAKQVFRSVFYLPKPRPLNYLVAELFKGPTLLLQGSKDPLQLAPQRANALKKMCKNVEVIMVEAGHCPFDEAPEFCNRELLKFIRKIEPSKPAPIAV